MCLKVNTEKVNVRNSSQTLQTGNQGDDTVGQQYKRADKVKHQMSWKLRTATQEMHLDTNVPQ